jgi:hypothetical protein
VLFLLAFLSISGCENKPAPKSAEPAAAAKPAEPAIPEEIQAAAEGSLGSETTVLAYGDLAKTGTQQILIANVLPKTPKDNITGTIVSRAAIVEKQGNNWVQIFPLRRTSEKLQGLPGNDADRAGERMAHSARTGSGQGPDCVLHAG